ncbi:MAG: hypothetical protein AB1758_09590 [Candidatus Eremiobacterota bacterium]
MSEDELRQIIETNFRLLAMTMRDASTRAGQAEQGLGDVRTGLDNVQTGLEEVRTGLEEVRTGLDEVRRGMDAVRTDVDELKALAAADRDAFRKAAETLESSLEAIQTLAFGSAETRQEVTALKEQMKTVLERLDRLERAG